MSNGVKAIKGIFIGLIVVFLASCYEAKEGCLDVSASNYDVTADKACADCCESPLLIIETTHVFGDEGFGFDSVYTFGTNNNLRVGNSFFLISDVSLVMTDGSTVTTLDSFEVSVLEGGVEDVAIVKDMNLIKSNRFTHQVGKITVEGTVDRVRFNVGLNNDYNHAIPVEEKTSTPLDAIKDSLYIDENQGYVFSRFYIQPDTSLSTIKVVDTQGPDGLIPIDLEFIHSLVRGANLNIGISVDYEKWFYGIDFMSMTEEEISNRLIQNTAPSFSVN